MRARKLTNEQAVEMRRRRAKGESIRSLSERFGVYPLSVDLIVTGRTYRDAGGPITPPGTVRAGRPHTRTLATWEEQAIRDAHKLVISKSALMRDFRVAQRHLDHILAGENAGVR